MRYSLRARVAFLRPQVTLAAVLAVVVGGLACDTQRIVDAVERVIAAIRLTPNAASLRVGTRFQVAATPLDSLGVAVSGVPITWRVADTAVASVSPSGELWGRAPGNTTVRATAMSGSTEISATAPVNVTMMPVAAVTVTPNSAAVQVGTTLQLVSTVLDSAGNVLAGRVVTWGSSNTAVASVNGSGLVNAAAAGSVTITATSEGRPGTAAVTVTAAPPPPPPPPPSSPSGLTATAQGQTTIALAWNDNAGDETGYRVERQVSGGAFSEIAQLAAGATTFSNTGLTAATTYGYRVRAINAGGFSGYSNTASATTAAPPPPPPPPPPPAPSGLTATAQGQTSIALAWADNATDETGYRVERQVSGGAFAEIAQLAAGATTFSNTGLTAATTYGYRVRAVNGAGFSGYSNTASATTAAPPPPPPPPAAPSGLTATAQGQTSIALAWADNATDETGYRVERQVSGGAFSEIAQLAAGATTFSNTGLTAATTYGYRVRAVNGAGFSGYSNTASATTAAPPPPPPPPPPAAPSGLVATTQSATAIAIVWVDNATNETGYHVEQQTSGGAFTEIAQLAAGITAYTSINLTASTTYGYRVRAVNAGGFSSYSNTATATTSAPTPGGSLAWFEDFRSGTLTARGLVREAANANVVIVSASGLGFPSGTTNVARNIHAGDVNVQWVANNLWRNPAVGEYVFLRMYIRNSLPNGANTGADHGNQCNVGDVKWAWLIPAGSGGTYSMDVANSAQSNITIASGIPKNSVQRLEWRLSRTASTAGVVTFRIYSATNVLLGEGTRNLSGMTDALYRTARWGLSGQAGASYVGPGIEWGNLAARVSSNSNDWIGAYPVAGAEQ